MIKIWAKVMKKGKIIKQYVLEKNEIMDYSLFYDYLREICENLDIQTPVVIKTHLFNYAKYNTVEYHYGQMINYRAFLFSIQFTLNRFYKRFVCFLACFCLLVLRLQ